MSEQSYLASLDYILQRGIRKPNRTGTDTIGVLGLQNRYDLSEGFPLFTTKKVWFKGVVEELLWFLRGETNVKSLVDKGVNIWNDDAYRWYQKHLTAYGMTPLGKEEFIALLKEPQAADEFIPGYKLGDLGPVYGAQWRKWSGWIDQIKELIKGLKNDPNGRRHILTAWNPEEIPDMALPPCHVMSMWTVQENKLTCHMVQRSCDMFLGVPFNVASYSLLTHMIAHVCGYQVGEFIHTMHDAHIYVDHIEQVKEQLSRSPKPLPRLVIDENVKNIDQFEFLSFILQGYNPHPPIKAPLSTAEVKNSKV
jgi:thymidylate synthase